MLRLFGCADRLRVPALAQVHAAQQAKRLSDASTAGDEAVAQLFNSACPVLANIRFTINLSL